MTNIKFSAENIKSTINSKLKNKNDLTAYTVIIIFLFIIWLSICSFLLLIFVGINIILAGIFSVIAGILFAPIYLCKRVGDIFTGSKIK